MNAIKLHHVGLFLLCFTCNTAQGNDKKADELEQFIGRWQITKLIDDGDPTAQKDLESFQIEFTESHLIFRSTVDDDEKQKYQFRIDVEASPKKVDLIEGKDGEGEVMRGFCKFDGEILTICLSNDEDAKRPTKFESKSSSNAGLIELKLIK